MCGDLGGLSVFVLCVAVAFVIQWIAFIPAYVFQTEKFYDLTGSATYITVTALALVLSPALSTRAVVIASLVVVWAVRLGLFLFTRIKRAGSDKRFDRIKVSLPKFLLAWTLQGLWVSFTLAAGLAAITSQAVAPLSLWDAPALLIWFIGFGVEVVADEQKRRHRKSDDKDRFISTGLWSWSRHPNYFGEICLWVGMAMFAFPALSGWQYVTLLSPVFVYVLLTRISGVPMLEASAQRSFGADPAYQDYVARTHVLMMWPPRKRETK